MSNKERARGERTNAKFLCDDGPPRLRQRPFKKALDRAQRRWLEPDEDFIEAALVVGNREGVIAHERNRYEGGMAKAVGVIKGKHAILAETLEERRQYIAKLEALNKEGEPSGSWSVFAIVKTTGAALFGVVLVCMGANMLALALLRIAWVDTYVQGLAVSAVTLAMALGLKLVAATLDGPHNRKRYLRALSIATVCTGLPYVLILARLVAKTSAAAGGAGDPYADLGDLGGGDAEAATEATLSFFLVALGVVSEATGASAAFEWIEMLYHQHGDASGYRDRAKLIHRHKRERVWETSVLAELAGALDAFDKGLQAVTDRALAIYDPRAAEKEVLAFQVTELRENRLAARAAAPPGGRHGNGSDTNFLPNGNGATK